VCRSVMSLISSIARGQDTQAGRCVVEEDFGSYMSSMHTCVDTYTFGALCKHLARYCDSGGDMATILHARY
jgi:hypothetical protein